MQKRFIVNDTFTSEETGLEYYQGAIYDIEEEIRLLVEQWMAEGKVRDPDDDDDEDEEEDKDEDNEEEDEDDEDPEDAA